MQLNLVGSGHRQARVFELLQVRHAEVAHPDRLGEAKPLALDEPTVLCQSDLLPAERAVGEIEVDRLASEPRHRRLARLDRPVQILGGLAPGWIAGPQLRGDEDPISTHFRDGAAHCRFVAICHRGVGRQLRQCKKALRIESQCNHALRIESPALQPSAVSMWR